MDYKNVPNTTAYPTEPMDLKGGISSGTISPNAYVAAILNSDDAAPKSHKGIIIGVIIVFALLTFGGIGFFFYQNSQQAAASTNDDPYQTVIVQVTSPVNKPTIEPTPTYLLPSVALTPTPDPLGPTPTFVPVVQGSPDPTPQPTSRALSWEISFPEVYYTAADVSIQSKPKFTGTLKSPFSKGATLCYAEDTVFFTKKKDSSTIQRLCDRISPTPSARILTCVKYNQDTGVKLEGFLYPVSNCGSPTSSIEPGAYVMAATVYSNCILPGSSMSGVPETACADKREVFSNDLNYTP
jgi:hypothetical protein